MRALEYRVEALSVTRTEDAEDGYNTYTLLDPEGLELKLSERASDGWRLVAMERVQITDAKGVRLCVFERGGEAGIRGAGYEKASELAKTQVARIRELEAKVERTGTVIAAARAVAAGRGAYGEDHIEAELDGLTSTLRALDALDAALREHLDGAG